MIRLRDDASPEEVLEVAHRAGVPLRVIKSGDPDYLRQELLGVAEPD